MLLIAAAAIRLATGEVFTGDTHADAAYDAGFGDDGGLSDAYFDEIGAGMLDEGFITTSGQFVSREAALEIARRADQLAAIDYPWESLLAEDVQYPEPGRSMKLDRASL